MAMGQPFRQELLASVIDRQRAVQVRVDGDAGSGITPAAGAGPELEQATVEGKGVVVPDGPLVLEATNAFELVGGRRRPPGRLGLRGRVGEARIKAREKPVEHALRLGERAGLGEAEFGDEPILEGAKEAFDPAFPFRRGGGDPADAELLEGPADLRGFDSPLQLLGQGERRAGIAVKDPMPVGIGGRGDAIAADEAAQQAKIAMCVFLRAKDTREDFAGGIIDGGVEDEPGSAVLEPGMVTAVHLDEQASLGHALAAAAMPGWPARAGTTDASPAQQSLHGFPGHTDPLALCEQFGELMIVHAGVAAPREGEDTGADIRGEQTRGGSPAIAVGESGRAMQLQAPPESPEVTR
jgi:hypothetical protein